MTNFYKTSCSCWTICFFYKFEFSQLLSLFLMSMFCLQMAFDVTDHDLELLQQTTDETENLNVMHCFWLWSPVVKLQCNLLCHNTSCSIFVDNGTLSHVHFFFGTTPMCSYVHFCADAFDSLFDTFWVRRLFCTTFICFDFNNSSNNDTKESCVKRDGDAILWHLKQHRQSSLSKGEKTIMAFPLLCFGERHGSRGGTHLGNKRSPCYAVEEKVKQT